MTVTGKQLSLPGYDDLDRANASIAADRSKATELLDLVADFVIVDDDDMALANGLLDTVKQTLKSIEAKRTSITKPMNTALKEVNAMFRQLSDRYAEIETKLKSAIATKIRQQQAEQDAALAKVQAGDNTAETLAKAHGSNTVEVPNNISVREAFIFTILRPELIPSDLCSPDPIKIRKAIAAGRELPDGAVEITWYDSVTARGIKK